MIARTLALSHGLKILWSCLSRRQRHPCSYVRQNVESLHHFARSPAMSHGLKILWSCLSRLQRHPCSYVRQNVESIHHFARSPAMSHGLKIMSGFSGQTPAITGADEGDPKGSSPSERHSHFRGREHLLHWTAGERPIGARRPHYPLANRRLRCVERTTTTCEGASR